MAAVAAAAGQVLSGSGLQRSERFCWEILALAQILPLLHQILLLFVAASVFVSLLASLPSEPFFVQWFVARPSWSVSEQLQLSFVPPC